MTETLTKQHAYRTARATLGCVHFPAGTFVTVEWSHRSDNGIDWYMIDATEHGPITRTCYPAHHLERFTF